jgi:hypothetical protein
MESVWMSHTPDTASLADSATAFGGFAPSAPQIPFAMPSGRGGPESRKQLVLGYFPGEGIGPELTGVALEVAKAIESRFELAGVLNRVFAVREETPKAEPDGMVAS